MNLGSRKQRHPVVYLDCVTSETPCCVSRLRNQRHPVEQKSIIEKQLKKYFMIFANFISVSVTAFWSLILVNNDVGRASCCTVPSG